MSSSQTNLWNNRGSNIQLLISTLQQGRKEQVPPATERPELDQSHLLVDFHPLLSHQATNKLMSYFSRAELKGGKCKRVLSLNTLIPSAACIQVLPPLLFSRRNAMGLHSTANKEPQLKGEPGNTQLPPASRVNAFDHSAQPYIPCPPEKVGINLPFLPLSDQPCVSSPASTHKVVGKKAFK